MKFDRSAMPTRSMQEMSTMQIKNRALSPSDIDADLTKQDSDNHHTLEIKINLPKRITNELKHNSRDVMLFHMIVDIALSKHELVINENKVFWKNNVQPNIAMFEPTKERELLTHKIIQNSVKNE